MTTERGFPHVPAEPLPDTEGEFDHDEMIWKLARIGRGLGFMVESEYTVAAGARVDVLWSASIANLGTVRYVFEVQKNGSVDSLVLNLQRARNNPSVQKVVVVGNEEALAKVRREVSTLPEDFRKSLAYLNVRDVFRAAELQKELSQLLDGLEFTKVNFPLA